MGKIKFFNKYTGIIAIIAFSLYGAYNLMKSDTILESDRELYGIPKIEDTDLIEWQKLSKVAFIGYQNPQSQVKEIFLANKVFFLEDFIEEKKAELLASGSFSSQELQAELKKIIKDEEYKGAVFYPGSFINPNFNACLEGLYPKFRAYDANGKLTNTVFYGQCPKYRQYFRYGTKTSTKGTVIKNVQGSYAYLSEEGFLIYLKGATDDLFKEEANPFEKELENFLDQ